MNTSPIQRRFVMLTILASTSLLIASIEACRPRKKDSSFQSDDTDPQLFTGGACQTSGRWVEAAMKQAEEIKTVIKNLRDNPKCTALVNSMDQLVVNPEEVARGPEDKISASKGTVAQMFAVSREITALSDYRRRQNKMGPFPSDSADSINLDKMMTDRMFQMAGLNTDLADAKDPVPNASGSSNGALNTASLLVDQVISFKARQLRVASAGIDMATTVFNALGDDQQCLVGKTPAIGTMAIAGAKLLGAYVGADSGLAAKAGSAIAAYFKFVKNKKFNNAIYGINDTEYLLSMSCLMETTSANYCALRDARYLQDDLMPKVGGFKPYWLVEDNVPDMMTGFKVLNQDVPVVADWLRKVVTGVTPRRKTDADYYNGVMGSLNLVQQKFNSALTAIAEAKYNFPKDDMQQRAAILKLATTIQTILNDANTVADNFPEFYNLASSPNKQLFDILGKDLPKECDINFTLPVNLVTPYNYLENGGNFGPLASPQAILDGMNMNLKAITDRISALVTAYVTNNLNIDQQNVASDFVVPSLTGNPETRLRSIRSYLLVLTERIVVAMKNKTARDSDKGFAKMFANTIVRINFVLEANKAIVDNGANSADDLGKFIEAEKAKYNNKSSLALSAKTAPIDEKGFRDRVRNYYSGPNAEPDNKRLMAALNFKLPGDVGIGSDWLIEDATSTVVGMVKAGSVNNPRLRRAPDNPTNNASKLALDDNQSSFGDDAKDQQLAEELLNTAYNHFDMMRFREGFFINRIAKAVYWDLSNQLVLMQEDYAKAAGNAAAITAYKSKWGNTTQKLMMMADNIVVDKINAIIPKDLQAAMIDQSKATALNFANLMALDLFKDSLTKHISGLKSITEGKTSDWEIQRDVVRNTVWSPYRALGQVSAADSKVRSAFEIGLSSYGGFVTGPMFSSQGYDSWAGMVGRWVRPDLYWSPYFWTDKTHFKDDEFGSLATLRGHLCMQTLAFADPTAFRTVCAGSYLKSVFERSGSGTSDAVANQVLRAPGTTLDMNSLSLSYDDWIGEHQRTLKLTDQKSLEFQSRRICAVYDNLRNNNIHMMKLRNLTNTQITQSLTQNGLSK